jgi:predicted secreted protein
MSTYNSTKNDAAFVYRYYRSGKCYRTRANLNSKRKPIARHHQQVDHDIVTLSLSSSAANLTPQSQTGPMEMSTDTSSSSSACRATSSSVFDFSDKTETVSSVAPNSDSNFDSSMNYSSVSAAAAAAAAAAALSLRLRRRHPIRRSESESAHPNPSNVTRALRQRRMMNYQHRLAHLHLMRMRQEQHCLRQNVNQVTTAWRQQFKSLCIQSSADTCVAERMAEWSNQGYLFPRRSKVTDIQTIGSVVFALGRSGICTAYRRGSLAYLGVVNPDPKLLIRSLFHNQRTGELVTVSLHKEDAYASLRCHAYILTDRGGSAHTSLSLKSRRLFADEDLRFPGFVEMDDVNGVIVTFDSHAHIITAHHMDTYKVRFSIKDVNIADAKLAPGVMVLLSRRVNRHVMARLVCLRTGAVIRVRRFLLHKDATVEIMELFGHTMFIKQKNHSLAIFNVQTGAMHKISQQVFQGQVTCLYVHKQRLVLALDEEQKKVTVFDLQGKVVSTLEDFALWSKGSSNAMRVTDDQEAMISLCHEIDRARSDAQPSACINVASIRTGRLLARLSQSSSAPSQHNRAIAELTTLHLDERHGELYTGGQDGMLYCWSYRNAFPVASAATSATGQETTTELPHIQPLFHIESSSNAQDMDEKANTMQHGGLPVLDDGGDNDDNGDEEAARQQQQQQQQQQQHQRQAQEERARQRSASHSALAAAAEARRQRRPLPTQSTRFFHHHHRRR